MRRIRHAAVIAVMAATSASATSQAAGRQNATATALEHAQYEFFSGRYDKAAAEAALLRSSPDPLPAYELRSSALHFRIKQLIGDASDKAKAFKQCAACPALLEQFTADITDGRAIATTRLKTAPKDQTVLYFAAKLDLNEVWLNNSTIGRRTGFGKYKDARRTIDTVLQLNPKHIRARVAHAWIDYAVDTRIPFGFKWVFGGGDRKRGLKSMREAAEASVLRFEAAEAWFGLWEMLIKEKQIDQALEVAKRLAKDFPENQELQKFISKK